MISFISKKTLFEYYLNKLQLMLVVRQHDVTKVTGLGVGVARGQQTHLSHCLGPDRAFYFSKQTPF